MASTKLTVTVSGGPAPVSIVVNLFKSGQHLKSFTREKSFSQNFTELGKGSYSLFVGGVNPLPSGSTRCEITTNEITLQPPDDTPVVKKGKKYLVEFHFTVN